MTKQQRAEIRERMRNGVITNADVDTLFCEIDRLKGLLKVAEIDQRDPSECLHFGVSGLQISDD